MKSVFETPFGAVVRTELLINSKRAAPYVLAVLFTAHAALWGARGAASYFGWSTNSDFSMVRNFLGFSFLLGLPLFNAVIMGDPVIRDFKTGIDPLIFSKPIGRASYICGKFFGNFLVLVCCQSAFVLTLILMQWWPSSRTLALPWRVFPYFKHFLLLVVISHLFLAAIYFTAGTLTRNSRLVYGLAVAFYPVFIAYQILFLKTLPSTWAILLDPLLMNVFSVPRERWSDAAWINQLAFAYSPGMFANRALMLLIVTGCLAIVYWRFSIAERPENTRTGGFHSLALSGPAEYVSSELAQGAAFDVCLSRSNVVVPPITISDQGLLSNINRLFAASRIELRFLRLEKSLVVIAPLAIFVSILELAFYNVVPDYSYSATFAGMTTKTLLFFLLGVTIFYTGEAMHRDRELRIEPMLWSMPVFNNVFLLSKFGAMLCLTLSMIGFTAITSIAVQLLRGYTPVNPFTYLVTYAVVLFPSLFFAAALSVALNVILRDKYVAYAVTVALAGGLFYLYSQGHNHWLYNPVMYGLWTNTSLFSNESFSLILLHRFYVLALAMLLLSVAHLCYLRKLAVGLFSNRRLNEKGWSALIGTVSAVIALVSGLIILRR